MSHSLSESDGVVTRGTISVPGDPGAAPARERKLELDRERFAMQHEIARGGMGRVVAAVDTRLGRRVAIKLALSMEAAAQDRLAREAAILSLLDHPAVLPVYEIGRQADGATYFITRLIAGETLEARLRDAGPGWATSLPVVVEVAEAIDAVHRQGVIHRDLKPSNILVDAEGRATIIDWGVARRLDDTGSIPSTPCDVEVTRPGMAVGTPGYWAPEQRCGEVGGPYSDVYALGAILFRMAHGQRALPGVPTGARLDAALAGAPRWLADVIATATAEDPAERYRSAAELAAALRDGIAGGSRRARGWWRGRSFRALVMVGAVVTIGSVTATPRTPETPRRPPPTLDGAGYWDGDFHQMVFAVDGDQVRAAYLHDQGQFVGRLVGDRIVGRWCEAPHVEPTDEGEAEFDLVVDVDRLYVNGAWRYANERRWRGAWNLHHVDGTPPAALIAQLADAPWRCGSAR
jgi:hypothetical protein